MIIIKADILPISSGISGIATATISISYLEVDVIFLFNFINFYIHCRS